MGLFLWSEFLSSLEPILPQASQKHHPCGSQKTICGTREPRISEASVNQSQSGNSEPRRLSSGAGRAPPEKPFAFLRFPPAEFLFLVEKGVSGGGVSPFERLGGIFSCIYSVSTRKNDIIEKSNSVKRASFQKLFYAKSF